MEHGKVASLHAGHIGYLHKENVYLFSIEHYSIVEAGVNTTLYLLFTLYF